MSPHAADAERQPLRSALEIAALLLAGYCVVSVWMDWNSTLSRDGLTTASALAILQSMPMAQDEKYIRLYTLASYPVLCLAALVPLLLAAAGARIRPSAALPDWMALTAIAVASVFLTLQAHLPFLLHHADTPDGPGAVVTQVPHSRAFRDAITYVWSSALLLVIPVVGSAKIHRSTKAIAALMAILAVASAYLPHREHQGSRTDNELIVFGFVVIALFHLSERIHRAMKAAQEERQRYEEQSMAATAEFRAIQARLEEREERRSAFLATAAHDLKQPLHSTVLYGDLLAQAINGNPSQQASADIVHYARILKSEIRSLANAFDAILDYSQIESGKVSAQVGEHRLFDIFTELERRFSLQAAERDLVIRFFPPPRHCVVQTDRDLFIRLLSNLLSNAVKFTAPRRKARARRGPHDICVRTRTRGLLTTVYVIDHGCGIPQDMLDAVFDAGVQVANAHRDRREGFGLGLASVRGIVSKAMQDHGVRIRSIEHRGTHVMVDVPIAFVQLDDTVLGDDAEPGGTSIDLDGAMIALVEDDERQRTALTDILQRAGAFVRAAGSLAEVIERLGDTVRYPDVVLTDFRLPNGESGKDVVEAIRQQCNGREIPSLILTADRLAASAAVSEMRGVEVLSKPIDRKTLLQHLSAKLVPMPSPLEELLDRD